MRIRNDRKRRFRCVSLFGGIVRYRTIVAKWYNIGNGAVVNGRQYGVKAVTRRQKPEGFSGIEKCRWRQPEQFVAAVVAMTFWGNRRCSSATRMRNAEASGSG
jgi:hypothetical protein